MLLAGTHAALVEGLSKHEKLMHAQIAQADRVRRLQTTNINNLYDCDKKQAEDEKKAHACRSIPRVSAAPHTPLCSQAQLEFFKSRLIDSIEEKKLQLSRQSDFRARRKTPEEPDPKLSASKRRQVGGLTGLEISVGLTAEEMKTDLDEILGAAERYSVRSAAVASEDLRSNHHGDAYFDGARQLLHCNGHTFERGSALQVFQQGQRVDDFWTLTAMNAVEVTLREPDGAKLKVTLAQLRNGRFAFRPRHSSG